ncbi:MAG: hypothetical protein MI862_22670 [Desulfobacterales bacterium]|nr:hypothetical protein [Desulfobacterales bacterium]
MIGMADTRVDEVDQIKKSLEYGDAKIKEIRERIKELSLLEQDILATREKLLQRMKALNPLQEEEES